MRQARAVARQRAWAAGAAPGQATDPDSWLTMDVYASVVPRHSDKENAAATWNMTYGFHPLIGHAGSAGDLMTEMLAVMCPRSSGGHITDRLAAVHLT